MVAGYYFLIIRTVVCVAGALFDRERISRFGHPYLSIAVAMVGALFHGLYRPQLHSIVSEDRLLHFCILVLLRSPCLVSSSCSDIAAVATFMALFPLASSGALAALGRGQSN